jgi:CRP-like cAMP-binding protein
MRLIFNCKGAKKLPVKSGQRAASNRWGNVEQESRGERPARADATVGTVKNLVSGRSNRLLALLRTEDRERLHRHLEPMVLEYRRPLYDANRPVEFVHFIETGVGSLVLPMANGQAAEVGTIGNEGFVGLPILLGSDSAPTTSVYVQVPGTGLRMRAAAFSEELERSAPMRVTMLHYAHAFFNQVAQSAACANFHSLEQRCCRWMLMTHDRMRADEFLLTQEFLAMMLGVRRAGVTVAAGALRHAGLIHYTRGEVTIIDRPGLERRACECYSVSKNQFDRLLGVDW